ncbi:MAG: hypothetical protein IT386_13370, partial [Deltaproteobacteria bacterium]|nr:hypothetical protein [Deltaproteobacteria bacterium]
MSTADLSNLLTSISKCNAARVVGALVSIDRWGERITYTQILGALEALTGASDLSIVYRGLQRAIDDGLIV